MAGSVYEGKTFDEAVRKGLEALRLTRAEAVITTIEEGKSGFLGIGSRPFRVSVARRPGGAIREPHERAGEDRRGRRGGGEERSGARGGRRGGGERSREATAGGRASGEERGAGARGRGGRERTAATGAHGRRSAEESAAEARPPRRGRADRERGVRADSASATEERQQGARPERSQRSGGERSAGAREVPAREARPSRETGVPAAAEPRVPLPVSGAPADDIQAGDEGERKRRRRGRRGGRGRRRSPTGAAEGSASMSGAPTFNGDEAPEPMAAAETHTGPGFIEGQPPSYAPIFEATRASEAGLSAMPSASPAPEASPAGTWAPPAAPRIEPETEPSYASRDTMTPVRPSAVDRSERHRARPESSPDMNVDELSSTSRRLTEELLRAMGYEPRVSVRAEGNRVDVTIEVDRDDDLLNGHQGETRQALQHLLNRFLNKGDGSRYHLQLEINDHWQHRETELEELAHRLADEAASRQVEVVSDHLNSQERRIVHMTLREDPRVKTYSLGSGAVKRVAVAPASFPDRSEDEPAL
jgi:spoIIIJ-associated protein